MLSKLLRSFISLDPEELRYDGFVKANRSQIEEGYNNVNNGNGWKDDNKKCPLCNEQNSTRLFERFGIGYLKCENCGVAYAERFPKNFSDIYNDENYKNLAKKAYLSNSSYRKERFAPERTTLIKKFIPNIPNPKLLDIGCGTGWFLEYAQKEGFNVSGIEFAQDLAQSTSERLNVRIYTIPINKLPETDKYDVITMFDVIEHVPNPAEIIESVSKHLSVGGILLIYTPNLESLAVHYLKEFSSSVIPVHHPFLFTRKSIEMLTKKYDLETVYYATKGSDLIDMYAHYSQLDVNECYSEFLHNNADLLQAVVDEASCGNHLRIIAKKSNLN